MKKILGVIFLLILLLSIVIGLFLLQRRVLFLPKAAEIGEISYENSYVFASPLTARANGKEKIRVTIFILDTEGRGVEGKPVFLGQDERLEIKPIQPVSDSLGRAIFDVTATAPADYQPPKVPGNLESGQQIPYKLWS